MSRRIRAIEHRCAAGLAGAHPSLQDRILLNYTTGLPTCLHQTTRPCPKKARKKTDSSFEAYTHKTCTTTHKINIKTRQKYRHNITQVQSLEAYSFPVITMSCICFLSVT